MTDKLIRVILTRSSSDVVVLKDVPVKQSPFTDEFNGPRIDKRWAKIRTNGILSLTDNPGCLTLTPMGISSSSLQLEQLVSGNWELELKIKPGFSQDPAYSFQGVGVSFSSFLDTSFDQGNADVSIWRGYGHDYAMRLFGQHIDTCYSEWYYFRLRSSNGVIYSSVSTDGVNYTDGCSQQLTYSTDSELLALYARSVYNGPEKPAVSFTACIDYFRVTSAAR